MPDRVAGEGEPLRRLAFGVESQEFERHQLDGFVRFSFQGLPAFPPDPVYGGRIRTLGFTHPAFDEVESVDRHAEDLSAGVLDRHRLELLAPDLDML